MIKMFKEQVRWQSCIESCRDMIFSNDDCKYTMTINIWWRD